MNVALSTTPKTERIQLFVTVAITHDGSSAERRYLTSELRAQISQITLLGPLYRQATVKRVALVKTNRLCELEDENRRLRDDITRLQRRLPSCLPQG